MNNYLKGGSSSLLLDTNTPSAPNLRSPTERPIHLAYLFFALLLASCATPKDVQHHVVISVKDQKLALLDREKLVAIYPASTSKYALGACGRSRRQALGALE